ncbi:hypothetical protein POM88_024308 [Heracleum sosnowskyi]|uniref:Uncharacterized protein n=1 Tax=Heracleum sosnowskyi TaxID=360622 RepID=A0AAD8I313_9APIA|nr:hypothetical protein POM88_024308 [Heracleum sosnowskyi]
MFEIGTIVFLAFYLSISGCNLLLLKWVGEKLARSDRWDVQTMDVVYMLLLDALVFLLIDMSIRKGAITRFLSRIHEGHNMMMLSFLCALKSLAHQYLMKGFRTIEGCFFGFFMIYVVLLFALHAIEEVSRSMDGVLSLRLSGHLAVDLDVGVYSSAIV